MKKSQRGPCVGCGQETAITFSASLANLVLVEVYCCGRACLLQDLGHNFNEKLVGALKKAAVCPIEQHVHASCDCTHQRYQPHTVVPK